MTSGSATNTSANPNGEDADAGGTTGVASFWNFGGRTVILPLALWLPANDATMAAVCGGCVSRLSVTCTVAAPADSATVAGRTSPQVDASETVPLNAAAVVVPSLPSACTVS